MKNISKKGWLSIFLFLALYLIVMWSSVTAAVEPEFYPYEKYGMFLFSTERTFLFISSVSLLVILFFILGEIYKAIIVKSSWFWKK